MAHTPHFDFVIVGAGSAGCVLAGKLSTNPNTRVLVLEAGPMDRNLLIHIPAGVYSVFRDPALNWNYMSEDEPGLDGRQVGTPRGKVVGGSSSINSMVYMRGHPLDYDAWESDFDLPGWSYADCLPYFRVGESYSGGADPWRGGDGPLGVTRGDLENPLYDALLAAGKSSGQGTSDDLNGYRPEGLARFDATKRNGRRCSAAVAHLHPAVACGNVALVTRAEVESLVFDSNRVAGLTFRRRGKLHRVEAGQVILSGGAINSPKLMMQSGIGPADDLSGLGITPRHHLPGVGQNLMDHPAVSVKVACTQPVTIDHLQRPAEKVKAGTRWMIDHGGIASSNIWEAGGLIRGNDQTPYPNLQYHFGPFGVDYEGSKIRLQQAMTLQIDQLHPQARGYLKLNPEDLGGKPLLHFNYFSNDHDRREMVEAVRKAREIFAEPSFDRYRGEEMFPGPDAVSDEEIMAAIRQGLDTDYHPCGTCRMGGDDDAVVDGEMRVRGLEGLRVVDASVMPRITSANLNAPTQMIAARAADFILGQPQLAQERPGFSFQQ
ncbi:MAG: choline dehydrogenase [Pseudomonadota bacterium]